MQKSTRAPREELITNIIKQNVNVEKLMDEWRVLINGSLPTTKRMTQSSFVHIISIMDKCGYIKLCRTKKNHCTFYKFELIGTETTSKNERGEVIEGDKNYTVRITPVSESNEVRALQNMPDM